LPRAPIEGKLPAMRTRLPQRVRPPESGPADARGRQRGFSILESLIVLAITALALTLVYSIGARATDAAFRIGRHALGAADARIDVLSVRAAIDALRVPPADGAEKLDQNFSAQAQSLSGAATFERATPCAGAGPVADLTLTLHQDKGATTLFCSVNPGVQIALGSIGGTAKLEYSEDLQMWQPNWTPDLAAATLAGEVQSPTRRVLFARIVDDSGQVYLVERMVSDSPHPPPAPF
jgi:prepilin-type N-terminal cleavage/methylation domain-containing protein